MRKNGYLWTSGVNLDTACSIRRPRFPIRVHNFGDSATFSVDFCILYSECPPYFYFQFVWPTDLESIPHASNPTFIIPTKLSKLEVDITIHNSTAELQPFCLLIRHVTWWPWPLTFWPWTVVIHGGSREQPCHQVWRPYNFSFMSYELWRFPLVSIENAYAVTAHAPNYVTRQ